MRFFSIKNLVRFLVIAIVIYSILLFLGDFNKVISELEHFNFLIIPVIMFFTIIDDVIRFVKWDYFLKRLGIRVPFKTSFLIFISGISMTITPAKVGEVLKSYLLKEAEGVEMRRSVMVVVIERMTDVLGLAILALIGSFAFIGSPYFQTLIILLIGLVIFAFILLTSKRAFKSASKILIKIPVVKNYIKGIDQIYESSKTLISFKSLTLTTTISVVAWFFECFAFFLLLKTLNAPLSILMCTFIFSFSSVFGSATILPGGLGATESSFVALLLLQGLSLTTASLATVIIRIGTLIYGLCVGILALYIFNKIIKKKM